jgi:voltage-gated potassium channel
VNNQAIFVILRRMRAPLLALIATYAVTVLGLVLMPGVNAQGEPERLSFFHAFYIITYTATTTGFGELPHPFSDAQRAWVTFSMYLSIVAWLYAIGALIALVRDPTFQRVFVESRFAAAVRRIREPFYIVCGYGDTGTVVVEALVNGIFSAVVIDRDETRINELALKDLARPVPALAADASLPDTLLLAGLEHPRCAGVIALYADDHTNLKIAISAKLLNPQLQVICRAASHDTQANMESFNTDAVINPFDSFADRLAMALHSPDSHLLYEWLTASPGEPLARRINPPRGTWVLCGYGRFGKALARHMEYEGVSMVIIEATPERVDAPEGTVRGRGTEAVTLREAHIERAVGIVAGTDDDANNLSMIVTARMLKPGLFMVARQNQRENEALFEAAGLDLVMQRSRAIARRILSLVSTPLLIHFLRHLRHESNDWAAQLIGRLQPLINDQAPEVWTVDVTLGGASALHAALSEGQSVSCGQLLSDPRDRDERLRALILLIRRGEEELLLPAADAQIEAGDRLLFAGRRGAARTLDLTLFNAHALRYVLSGASGPNGALWRWLRGEA